MTEATNPPPFQVALPHAKTVLVLGIASILICCFAGIILGIIALVLGKKANALYWANPGQYTLNSYNNLKVGKMCAVIGLVLTGLITVYYLLMFIFIGNTLVNMPWGLST